jgi:multiple sugar transport system permease protein
MSIRRILGNSAARAFLILGGIVMLLPLGWMLTTALKDEWTIQNYPGKWKISIPQSALKDTLLMDYILVMNDELEEWVLEDFEEPVTPWTATGAEVSSSTAHTFFEGTERQKKGEPKVGERMLAIDYDFTETSQGQWQRSFSPPTRIENALNISFWVYGNDCGYELSLEFTDGDRVFSTKEPLLVNFRGWRKLYAVFWPEDQYGERVLFAAQGKGGPITFAPTDNIHISPKKMKFTLIRLSYAKVLLNKILNNFRLVLRSIPFSRYYVNTLLIAFAVTLGQVATSAFAAYAFARLDFPGRDKIFYGYLATMMIPGAVTMIPRFVMVKWFGWFDTLYALIIPGLSTTYGTFLLRQFFKTLPRDLEDAARIDGCSLFGIFWRIILPLSKPALITLTVISFMGAWQMFLWPLIVTKSQEYWTLQIGLAYMGGRGGEMGSQYNLIMAGALIVLIPQVIIFMAAQKFFQRGIVLSGLKE